MRISIPMVTLVLLLSVACGGGEGAPSATVPPSASQVRVTFTPPISRGTPSPTPRPTLYTIVPGDTLSQIAVDDGTTLSELLAVNPGIDPNNVPVGTQIRLPSAQGLASSTAIRSLSPQASPTRSTSTTPVGGTPTATRSALQQIPSVGATATVAR
jgi:LysM repeat protein